MAQAAPEKYEAVFGKEPREQKSAVFGEEAYEKEARFSVKSRDKNSASSYTVLRRDTPITSQYKIF